MKALMLAAIASSSIAPVISERAIITNGCGVTIDNDYHPPSLIDPNRRVIVNGERLSHPRYILTNVKEVYSEPFELMGQRHGEIDKCLTNLINPGWYQKYPDTDPSYEYLGNPGGENARPTTISQAIENIHKYKVNLDGVRSANDWTFWNIQTTSGIKSTKIEFTYEDTVSYVEEKFSLYFNVGVIAGHPNYDVSVAIVPGTKYEVNSDHQSVKELNVMRYTGPGALWTVPSHENVSYMYVPSLFKHVLSFNDSHIVWNNLSKVNKLNPYIVTSRGGYDNSWGWYVDDIMAGFNSELPENKHVPSIRLMGGANQFRNLAYNFNMYVYKMLNAHCND